MKKYPLGLVIVLALGSCAFSQNQAPAPAPSSSSPGMGQSSSADPSTSATQVDDQTLNTKLRQQFDTDATLKGVQIKVSNGNVDLTGTVPSKEDRRRAKEMAQAVPGVKSVRDKIEVAATGGSASNDVSSHTATSETAHNTAGSIAGNSNTTSASTGGQTTTTPGSTPGTTSEASGSASRENAGQANQSGGITGTANATGAATDKTGSTSNTGPVGAPTAGASGQPGTTTSGITSSTEDPVALRSELDSAFQSEPTLSTSHIVVSVSDNTIQLTGSVPTPKERLTAKRIAQSYAGNRKVDDKLTVGGHGSSSNQGPGSSSSTGSGSSSDMGVGTNTRTTGTTPATKDPSMNPPATDNQQTAPPAENPKTQGDQSTTTPK